MPRRSLRTGDPGLPYRAGAGVCFMRSIQYARQGRTAADSVAGEFEKYFAGVGKSFDG